MNPSDNIGLTDFLVLVYRFLIRNLLIIGLTTLLGVAIGFSYSFQKKSYFYSELIGFSNILEKTTLMELLSPLSSLVKEKNYTEIATKLGITQSEAMLIRSLEFQESRHLKTSNAPKLTDTKLGELVLVKVEVYDQEIYPKLSAGLSFYLKNNPYIANLVVLEINKTKALINRGSNYLTTLDSLSLNKEQAYKNEKITISNKPSPVDYNEAALEIEDLKISEKTLQAFTVVSEFYHARKPANKTLIIITAITMAFFFLSLLVVFVRELASLAKK